jgi:tRNA G10  N-methylase Trm11
MPEHVRIAVDTARLVPPAPALSTLEPAARSVDGELPGREPALFILKADVETADDAQLAFLELEALSGHHIAPLDDCRLGDLGDSADRLISAGIAPRRILVGRLGVDPSGLARRLGMIEEIWTAVADPLKPIQTSFERAAGASGAAGSKDAPGNRRKNEYLTHPLHKYKAKFFPRMARALVNFTAPDAGQVLDPFVGSGTLLLESTLMGVPSTGLDIDPLSVVIAGNKVAGLNVETAEFDSAVEAFGLAVAMSDMRESDVCGNPYVIPEFLGRKMPETREQIESEITVARNALLRVEPGGAKELARVALSHAVATKISLRWMGTGDNRFSLAVAKRPVAAILGSQLKKIRAALVQRDELLASGALDLTRLAAASATTGDVRAMQFESETFEGIVTSPPYLPASSGRETYLRSRAPSLVAMGLLTEQEITERDRSMIGSILRSPSGERTVLPTEVSALVEWMKPQRARAPKAVPTGVYFHDLAASLKEMGRVLAPGGTLAMVLSSSHTFYDLVTRKTVRTLEMPAAVSEMIDEPQNEIPLKVDRVVQIELPKMDFAARPASRGRYSESIILASRA